MSRTREVSLGESGAGISPAIGEGHSRGYEPLVRLDG